jgi:diadenosine tetraphosphate (Ap4A) HIT family hydrolase
MQDSVFTKIINKQVPAVIIYEDDENIAILSINPNSTGHALVIPKVQVDEFTDASEQVFLSAMGLAQKLSKVLKRVFKPNRIGLVIEGLAVPHLHIHLIPMGQIGDLDHDKAGNASMEELEKVGKRIRDEIDKNGLK